MTDPEIERLERLRRELERLVHTGARGADDVVRSPHSSPSVLHAIHRNLRRLRTGLAVWIELVRPSRRDRLVQLDRRLRRLAQLVGQVRDRDVAVDLLGSVEPTARRRRDREQLARYQAQLRDDARTGRELLRALFRSETDARLFDEVADVLSEPVRDGADRAIPRLLSDHRSKGHAKLVTAHRRARRRPSMNRLHRLRIRVRRLRQFTDLVSEVDRDMAPPLVGSWRSLQQGLGRLHDLDVMLYRLDTTLRSTRWARALRKERRRQRRRIIASLDSSRPAPAGPSRARSRRP